MHITFITDPVKHKLPKNVLQLYETDALDVSQGGRESYSQPTYTAIRCLSPHYYIRGRNIRARKRKPLKELEQAVVAAHA